MTLAGIGIVVAGFFLWQRDFDKAFVMAALGLVAWFLSYRVQLREIIKAAEDDEYKRDELDIEDENDD